MGKIKDVSSIRRTLRDLLIRRLMTQPTKKIDGLTQAEIFLVEYLAEDGPLEQIEIRRRFYPLGEDQVSKLVSGLVSRGLVSRERRSDDGRGKVVRLTLLGETEAEVRRIVGAELVERHFGQYSEKDRVRYFEAARTIVELDTKLYPRGDPPRDPREIDEFISQAFADSRKRHGFAPLNDS